jgi:formylglycine-generating enzyme required for sulfatase activity
MCLDDAAEKYPQPFVELLEIAPGDDADLWKRQLVALRILERLDPNAVDERQQRLARHPSTAIRQWIGERIAQTAMDVVTAKRGGYELAKISGGNFMMGSPETEEGHRDLESPLHEVRVPDFYLGRFPVTNEEYGRFLTENPDISEPEYWADRRFNQLRQPVVGVSWEDAHRYAAWAGLRLPSEAEWEYACRANTNTRYYTGDTEKDLDRAGWYEENSGGELHPVGEKEPNAYSLYAIHGNVYEWVGDDWHDNYDGAPDDGRAWIDKPRGARRVIRGGGWGSGPRYCRSARRSYRWAYDRYDFIGFRLSRSVALGP